MLWKWIFALELGQPGRRRSSASGHAAAARATVSRARLGGGRAPADAAATASTFPRRRRRPTRTSRTSLGSLSSIGVERSRHEIRPRAIVAPQPADRPGLRHGRLRARRGLARRQDRRDAPRHHRARRRRRRTRQPARHRQEDSQRLRTPSCPLAPRQPGRHGRPRTSPIATASLRSLPTIVPSGSPIAVVSGPFPAVVRASRSSASRRRTAPRAGSITGGTPTWKGQNLEDCERQINTFGLTAFRAESQHEGQREGRPVRPRLVRDRRRASRIEAPLVRFWDMAATRGQAGDRIPTGRSACSMAGLGGPASGSSTCSACGGRR